MATMLCLFFICSSYWIQEVSTRVEKLEDDERKLPVTEVERLEANFSDIQKQMRILGHMYK